MDEDNRLGKHLNNSTKIYTPVKPVTGEAQRTRMAIKCWENELKRGEAPPALMISRHDEQAVRKTALRLRPGKDTFHRGDGLCD